MLIAPSHVEEIEERHQLGLDTAVAYWKAAVAALTDGIHVRAWDFSGPSHYVTEPLPHGRATAWRYFWETVHFRPQLGTLMIQRLEGAPTDPAFGVPLQPATLPDIETHQAAAMATWRASHPEEVAWVAAVIAQARSAVCPTPSACKQRVAER